MIRPRRLKALARLRADQRGVTAVEFALIAPVFLILVIETFDLGQMAYGTAVLNGAVQKAARDSSLETASTLTADNTVKKIVQPVIPNGTITTTRTSYFDFTDVGRPERWNDANNNGSCDNNESYVDENENAGWDRDIGETGNGGASDVVIYTVNVQYNPIFKIPFFPASWNTRNLTATAVRKNQPFAAQDRYGSSAGICS